MSHRHDWARQPGLNPICRKCGIVGIRSSEIPPEDPDTVRKRDNAKLDDKSSKRGPHKRKTSERKEVYG